MSRVVCLALLLFGCVPDDPITGWGLPATVEVDGEQWVDTNGDDVADVPLAEWCHPTVLEDPQVYREASYAIREAIPGFSAGHNFKLNTDGTVAICVDDGDRRDKPLSWACRDGEVDVFASGVLANWGGQGGLMATVEFKDYIWSPQESIGIDVVVTGGKDGRVAEGTLLDLDTECK